MGIIRTILALLVVVAHARLFDHTFPTAFNEGAIIAVKMFFIISGFYMSLVLDRKYSGRTLLFYRSRALRLFPLYWGTLIVAALYFVAVPSGGGSAYSSTAIRALGDLFSTNINLAIVWSFANLTFVGLDWGNLSCFAPDTVVPFCTDKQMPKLRDVTIIGPAWTLGIEILFYLIVPFVYKKGWPAIITLIGVSLLSRVFLVGVGLNGAPWDRSFFLSEFIYFALGMISYKAYRAMPQAWLSHYNGRQFLFLSIVAVLLYAYVVPIPNLNVGDRELVQMLLQWGLMFSFAAMLPFIYHHTAYSRIDFMVGELSYPIYITHFLTLAIFKQNAEQLMIDAGLGENTRAVAYIGAVVIGAVLAVMCVALPVEMLRGRAGMEARYTKT